MTPKTRIIVTALAAVTMVTAAAFGIFQSDRDSSSLHSREATLTAAYHKAWSAIDREYASHSRLPPDWANWLHKFDGKIKSADELTTALNALLQRVGDDQVRLLLPAEVTAMNARESGGHLGYGVTAKFLPVYGGTARLRVTEHVYGECTGDKCWEGEGQGHKDGLRDGDILTAVDGKSFAGLSDWDLMDYIVSHDQSVFTVKRGDQTLNIAVHPVAEHKNANYGLDIYIEYDGARMVPFVFADSLGPAMQAGIAEKDELVRINGEPVEKMTDAQLKALSGECKPGDTLKLSVRRLGHWVTIPCGLVPYTDNNFKGSGGGGGAPAEPYTWQVSLKNLDDPKVPAEIERFLSEYVGTLDIRAIIDLRAATGTNQAAEERLASFFIQNADLPCEIADWRDDALCDSIKGGRINQWGRFFTTGPTVPFKGKIVVVIDDDTSGTALILAAVLQKNGATVITSGAADLTLPDTMNKESLPGDPLARWIQYPAYHVVFADRTSEFTADVTAKPGEEFKEAQRVLGLSREPYDLREFD